MTDHIEALAKLASTGSTLPWEKVSARAKDVYRRRARAMLAYLLNPTTEMIDAGLNTGCGESAEDVKRMFVAMLAVIERSQADPVPEPEPKPDAGYIAGEWIKWEGKGKPTLPDEGWVEAEMRQGSPLRATANGMKGARWSHNDNSGDIVRYRIFPSKPDKDGWVAWNGHDDPTDTSRPSYVPEDHRIKMRDGSESRNGYRWNHKGAGSRRADIVAWKPIEEKSK